VNLTKTQARVAHHVADGHPNPEIARALYLSVETVKSHVRNLLALYGVRDRHGLIFPLRNEGYGSSPLPDLAPLSPRQRQLLSLAAQGLERQEIAARMGITDLGVKSHLRRLSVVNGMCTRARMLARLHDQRWRSGRQ
jgi:DNA-binding CsgD family transcriptional regulator